MKYLIKDYQSLISAGRWDADYHLPPEAITQFPANRIVHVSSLADVSIETRDPSANPEGAFIYIDIASIDPTMGLITNPQELTGEEAPSRARMVIRAFDVIVSTVRPTRGAIAVIPPEFDNQICSTGFCVLRCKENTNPYYLHLVLRSPSTLEQFRKFSTGSNYPAILDDDVLKSLVPSATTDEQDYIAEQMITAYREREKLLKAAKLEMDNALAKSIGILHLESSNIADIPRRANDLEGVTIRAINNLRQTIPLQKTLL